MRVEVRDFMSPELRKLAKKTRDLRPAMKKIETFVMSPLRVKAWAASGLESHSGDLRDSVETWSGKKSAGIAVHPPSGRSTVMPKAVVHTEGRRRRAHSRKTRYTVGGHRRGGTSVSRYTRRNTGSPWGDIKARGFIPTRMPSASARLAARIIEEYLDV